MRTALIAFLFLAVLPAQLFAQARLSVLNDVLRINELAHVLSDEGAEYGQSLDREMLNGEAGGGFHLMVRQIYDPARIAEGIHEGLAQHMDEAALEEAIAFFASPLGVRIVSLELDARIAFADRATEETARARYTDLRDQDPARHALIVRLINAGDLVQRNVTATMNADIQYYRGLIDGDMIEMDQSDILDAVTADLDGMTEDTEGWLGGFMTLAYSPLSDADLEAYASFAESEAGHALNRGFFAGFDPLYEDISYALGRAVALNMASEEL